MLGIGQSYAAEISRQQMLSQPNKILDWVAKRKIRFEQIPNPHWNNNDCKTCHSKTPVGKQLYLRNKNIDQLCEYCHSGGFDHSYIHPSGVSLGNDLKRANLAKDFQGKLDRKQRLSCTTCHDVLAQCLPKRARERGNNPAFLRGGPYRDRTEFCFKCHDQSAYDRRNAHDQINDKGELQEYTCLICHDTNKGLKNATSIDQVGFNVKDNLVWVCGTCHHLRPHPSAGFTFTKKGEPNHLVVPPDSIKQKMLRSEKEHQVILPLEPKTGKIFCATCHNPHEKGVIKVKPAAKGADEPKRLRMQNLCTNCHDK